MKCSAGLSGPNCSTGQLRSFTYDTLGRMTQATNPESNTFTYSYSANGGDYLSLQSRTDPRGITTSYSYDAAGRTSRLDYSDGTYATFSYDASGNLTRSENANVTNNYTSYDGNNRVTGSSVQVAGQTYSFIYGYDLAGDLKSETYPSGRVLNTTFDVAARPATTTSQGSTAYVQQAGYWPSGAGYYWQYGNTVWPVEGYTAQLTPWYNQAALNNNGNSYLLALGTTWNANNTVQQTSEGFGASAGTYNSLTFLYQNYTYDHLNRLQAVIDTNYSRGFNYDEFGNMSLSEYGTVSPSTLAPLSGGGRPNPYDPGTNRLLSNVYGYDARGDMTTLGAVTMTYDAEANQTKTVDSGTGQTISYTFDAEGQRVEKQIAGGATIVDVHDAFGNLAAEYNSVGVTPACTTCYLVYDGVGSVRLVTDQNGNIIARHDYLPFGDEIANSVAGRSGNFAVAANITQGFTGQESDGGNGGTGWLDYFNARHMSAAIGSFTQPDPMQAGADFLNPQSWNGYGYVLGNPLGLVDPSGMSTITNPCGGSDFCITGYGVAPTDPLGLQGFGGGGNLKTVYYGTDPLYGGGGDPVFGVTGYGKGDVQTVSTPPSTFLYLMSDGSTTEIQLPENSHVQRRGFLLRCRTARGPRLQRNLHKNQATERHRCNWRDRYVRP